MVGFFDSHHLLFLFAVESEIIKGAMLQLLKKDGLAVLWVTLIFLKMVLTIKKDYDNIL